MSSHFLFRTSHYSCNTIYYDCSNIRKPSKIFERPRCSGETAPMTTSASRKLFKQQADGILAVLASLCTLRCAEKMFTFQNSIETIFRLTQDGNITVTAYDSSQRQDIIHMRSLLECFCDK